MDRYPTKLLKMEKECHQCHKRPHRTGRKYCSIRCAGLARRGEHPKTEFRTGHQPYSKGKKLPHLTGEKNPSWKGGKAAKYLRYNRKHKQKRYFWNVSRRIRKLGADGTHTIEEWEILKAQYNWVCPCCGRREPEIRLTEDHIVPLSKGGSNNIENIQPLCRSCNSIKLVKEIRYAKRN